MVVGLFACNGQPAANEPEPAANEPAANEPAANEQAAEPEPEKPVQLEPLARPARRSRCAAGARTDAIASRSK